MQTGANARPNILCTEESCLLFCVILPIFIWFFNVQSFWYYSKVINCVTWVISTFWSMPRQAEGKLEYQDFFNFTLTSLRNLLTLRGFKQTGKKLNLWQEHSVPTSLKYLRSFLKKKLTGNWKKSTSRDWKKHRINTEPIAFGKKTGRTTFMNGHI